MNEHLHPHHPTTICVRGLRKRWPSGVEAVKGIDFDVAPGEVFGLLGPNGAGKSTTIGMLTTTVQPTAGTALLDGHDVTVQPRAARAASAVVFQDAVVDRALTGRRNLQIHAQLWGVDGRVAGDRIRASAIGFGLTDLLDRPVGTYSGGQRRRLEIARALLSEPKVLFLDEPTVGLDPRIRYELLDQISALRDRSGMTILLTTHYLDEAERLCDRVGIMHAGRIVALDTPQHLLGDLGPEVVELRLDTGAPEALDPPAGRRDRRTRRLPRRHHHHDPRPRPPGQRGGVSGHRPRPPPGDHEHSPPHPRRRLPPPHRRAACGVSERSHPRPCRRPNQPPRSTSMSVITAAPTHPVDVDLTSTTRRSGTGNGRAFVALARRRFALSARTPREILVPLLTPVLFALVIAPALGSIGPKVPGLDYMSFAAVGTAALLVPLNCMFSGIGVILDRESGARRDLLAAPIARPLIVVANLAVALAITALQVAVLLGAARLRGAELHPSASGAAWFVGAAVLLAVGMYGVAETLANRIPTLEEYTGALPALAIVPFFFAGSLFPITALPGFLTAFARVLPLTHALALMRYGVLGHNATGLHDIWGMSNASAEAGLSLLVVATFAAALTTVAIRTFTRAAVR